MYLNFFCLFEGTNKFEKKNQLILVHNISSSDNDMCTEDTHKILSQSVTSILRYFRQFKKSNVEKSISTFRDDILPLARHVARP